MLRKTEDIVHKVEGCQDLVQLSTPLPSVSAAMASSTGLDAITLPVALVATGAVVGAGATTAMTAPVATSATPRPRLSRPARHHVLRTRRVWRAYVHDHPRRARRPSRARCPRPRRAPASAAPTTGAPQADPADCRRRGVQALHGDPCSPRSARRIQPGPYEQPHVPACAACVCAPARLPGTLLPRTVAGRCRGRPGCRPAARSCRALSWLSGAGAVLGLGRGPRNSLCSGPSMRHRPLGAAVHARARTLVVVPPKLKRHMTRQHVSKWK